MLLVAAGTGVAPTGHQTVTATRPLGDPIVRRPAVSGVDGGVMPMVAPPSMPLPPLPPLTVVEPGPPAVPADVVGTAPAVSYAGGIPSVVLAAYQNAAAMLARSQPNCRLPVALLAAIGKVESDHAEGGRLDAAGNAVPPILGPELNGTNGTAAIPATDHGALDGDPVWERAVGPMQFIPSTWRNWASDGNNDGVADPENVWDATLAAGRYLCADGRDLSMPTGVQAAILSYNDSAAYLRLVSAWLTAYQGGITTVADVTAPPPSPTSTTPPQTSTPTPAPTTTVTTTPTPTPSPTPVPTTTTTEPPTTTPVVIVTIPVPPTTTTTAPTVPSPPPAGSPLCGLGDTLGALGGLLGLGSPVPPCPTGDGAPPAGH